MIISVCIATYKREALLEMLLESLIVQELHDNISLEIVVVDNNSEGSAYRVLQKFNNSQKILFKYLIQPEKNISLARNMCVKNATGKFICFIDDDETASKNWVSSHYNALLKFNADGAFGYTKPIFDVKIPDHFKNRKFYFTFVGVTGGITRFYFTTNTIVRADLIKSEAIPFDPGYGLTGGEDVHLFERLAKKGAKFIDCREALTYEFIPEDRGTETYLFKRALRGGQAFVHRRLEQNNKISNKLIILTKALIMSSYSSMLYFLKYYSKYNKLKNLQILGASIGKIRSVLKVYQNIY